MRVSERKEKRGDQVPVCAVERRKGPRSARTSAENTNEMTQPAWTINKSTRFHRRLEHMARSPVALPPPSLASCTLSHLPRISWHSRTSPPVTLSLSAVVRSLRHLTSSTLILPAPILPPSPSGPALSSASVSRQSPLPFCARDVQSASSARPAQPHNTSQATMTSGYLLPWFLM